MTTTRPHTFRLDTPHSLLDLVKERLASECYFATQNVEIECEDEQIRLSGIVHSYYEKQQAQEALLSMEEEFELANELEVCYL